MSEIQSILPTYSDYCKQYGEQKQLGSRKRINQADCVLRAIRTTWKEQ